MPMSWSDPARKPSDYFYQLYHARLLDKMIALGAEAHYSRADELARVQLEQTYAAAGYLSCADAAEALIKTV